MDYKYEDFLHDYDEDEDYFGREDELAFVYSLDKAFAGTVEYMRILGIIYSSHGHGVKIDYDKAIFWFYKAAELGDEGSALRLADIYFDCEGVPHDYKKALLMYEIAAKAGNRKATARLGIMYFYGFGCEKNNQKARELIARAAAENEWEGLYYYYRVLKADGDEAWVEYLKRAAYHGNGKACWDMIKNFADELDDKKFLLYLAHAANHYSFDFEPMQAQLMLADCYMRGYRMKKSLESAWHYYKMAAEGGSQEAKEALKQYFMN